MTTDKQELEDLRALYAETPPLPAIPLEQIARGARRRQHRRRLAIAAGASVGIAAVVAPLVIVRMIDGSTEPSQPSNSPGIATEPTPGIEVDRMQKVTDAVYAILDSEPDLGYYMLRTDAERRTIELWGNFATRTLASLRETVTAAGATLEVRPLPADLDPYGIQPTVEEATEQMRRLIAEPGYGFTELKVQLPLKNIIIWRVTPDSRIDDRLAEIARESGLELELRNAVVSRADAQRLTVSLRAQNTDWQAEGFQVKGSFARPTGFIVIVEGDVQAAGQNLMGRQGIIGVLEGTEIDHAID